MAKNDHAAVVKAAAAELVTTDAAGKTIAKSGVTHAHVVKNVGVALEAIAAHMASSSSSSSSKTTKKA